MRWRAPSDRVQTVLFAPIAIPLAVFALPFVLLLVVLVKLEDALRPSGEWHRWFAWRPVPIGHWSEHVGTRGTWAWLQFVERRSRPYDWPTEYRLQAPPEALDR